MEMTQKSFTLVQTVATAGVFSAISFWYGFISPSGKPLLRFSFSFLNRTRVSAGSDMNMTFGEFIWVRGDYWTMFSGMFHIV
ncbi:hypothetical protein K1719_029493 [Acacia pycnantha]|nr:hypothetical protein K1719_029493 [Acacia pycnantha]